jgi:hypothetical protein
MPLSSEILKKLPACIAQGAAASMDGTKDLLRAYVLEEIRRYKSGSSGHIQTLHQLRDCQRYLKWLDLLDFKPGQNLN